MNAVLITFVIKLYDLVKAVVKPLNRSMVDITVL